VAFGRIRDAVSDVAETLRRAYTSPVCGKVSIDFLIPGSESVPSLVATSCSCDYRASAIVASVPVLTSKVLQTGPVSLVATVHAEDAWEEWGSEAKVCATDLFRVENCGRMEVPPLPRRPKAYRPDWNIPEAFGRVSPCGIGPSKGQSVQPRFTSPRIFQGLSVILNLPVSIQGEDWQSINKALWMRYTFQFVKGTGENIRNVEILGLFRVPTKGVVELRHDQQNNRLLVKLDSSAYSSPKHLFILARRKADRCLVSCYLEED
jgi:hypothetical protein